MIQNVLTENYLYQGPSSSIYASILLDNPGTSKYNQYVWRIVSAQNYGNNSSYRYEELTSDFSNLDLFFKSIRIRILYGNGNDYVRIKLRSLLTQYGYQRRSQLLLQHIKRCMLFYHLEATLRGGAACDIETCDLDKMLIFRVI